MLRKTVYSFGLFALSSVAACSSDAGTPVLAQAGAASGGAANGGAVSGGTAGSSGASTGGAAGAAQAGAGSGGAAGAAGSAGAAGAGTAGAGTAGAGTAGGSGGTGSAPLFSDDFEAATISSKWTPRINSNAMFDLDKTQKHGGSQSLHLKHTGFSTLLAAEGAPIFPAPNNTFYGRLWLRVAELPANNHVIWFEAGDVMNDVHEVRVGMNLGKFQSNLMPSDTDIRDPAAKLMANTWHCVQFKYGVDVLEVSLDGVKSSISTTNWVAMDSANGQTTPKPAGWSPTYAAFRIGWELQNGEIWYDDVALSHSPVACN